MLAKAIAGLCLLYASASPMPYWQRSTDAVRSIRDAIRNHRTRQSDEHDKDPTRWAETAQLHASESSAVDDTAWSNVRGKPISSVLAQLQTPLVAGTNLTDYCGNASSGQKMWFTENKCSLASADMTYWDTQHNLREARAGEPVDMACDSLYCPTPKVPDCYTDPGICAPDEWCMLNQQEVWDAAGVGGGNSIVQLDFCAAFFNASEWSTASAEDYRAHLQLRRRTQMQAQMQQNAAGHNTSNASNSNTPEVTLVQAARLFASARERCGGTDGGAYGVAVTGAFDFGRAARGRCVRYRQAGESCVPQMAVSGGPLGLTGSLLPKTASGRQFARPLLCDAAKGLACTGARFDVLPSTCVAARPKDVCYLGPWWDSSICPRTVTTAAGGLDYATALDTVRSFLLLFPGNVASPSECRFWDGGSRLGAATRAAREDGYRLVAALWPAHLGGAFASPGLPPLPELEADLGIPLLASSRAACDAGAADAGSRVAYFLALNHLRAERANFIWSLVHFLVHNQPEAGMSAAAVAASRGLADHLSQRFWCTNCRNYFTVGVVEPYGLPPDSPDGRAHARYWNFGHNVASEHVATTRGDDPWIYQLGEARVAALQNPFWVSFEQAEAQWKYRPAADQDKKQKASDGGGKDAAAAVTAAQRPQPSSEVPSKKKEFNPPKLRGLRTS